ncbi:MAG: HDIG domain-containing protein [Streptococcaceae bacterium]|jgi:uncharacterized protein|nr:HDIG domain-containing protein [Streptococcaceae bacterium]
MNQPWLKDKEYMLHVRELLETQMVQNLQNFVHHHHSNRLEHSLNVSYTGFKVAKKLNINARSIARAGLLHDLFFYDRHEFKNEEKNHAYIHARIAVLHAEQITELSDLEKDIILKHMWGATFALPRYKESYIVTFVDKYWAIKEVVQPFVRKWKKRKIFKRRCNCKVVA